MGGLSDDCEGTFPDELTEDDLAVVGFAAVEFDGREEVEGATVVALEEAEVEAILDEVDGGNGMETIVDDPARVELAFFAAEAG